MSKLLFFCPNSSKSLQYVIDFITPQFVALEFEFCHSEEYYRHAKEFKINYSQSRIDPLEFFIWSNEKLNNIEKLELAKIEYQKSNCILFPNVEEDDLGFDLFAAIFWMLSRFEEKINHRRDEHGRFLSTYSIFAHGKEYKRPLVDEWVDLFVQKINEKFNSSFQRSTVYKSSLGIDVDQAWKYSNKSLWKSYAAIFRDLLLFKFQEAKERFSCIALGSKDPYDSFDEILQLPLNKQELIFFILNGDDPKFDPNHNLSHPEMIKLIRRIADKARLGLHPSYRTSEQTQLIQRQKKELERIAQKSITCSRQHYLRFLLPDTFIALEKSGIKEDYSMLYADDSGFRSGTSHPFYYFDIQNNRVTDLIINPVIVMDRTYLKYLKVDPSYIFNDLNFLIQQCKKYKGCVHIVWHNSSMDYHAEWKGWETVLEKIVALMKS
ncbi:MAG: polysaccharide deacetylase family protein [Saprospiraceae bacterium]